MTSSDAIEAARQRYVLELPQFKLAAVQMRDRLEEIRRIAGVRAEVEAREKTTVSVIKKLHLKGSEYTDPWNDLTDKVGARLITETLLDLVKIRAVFENPSRCPLQVLRIEDKTAEADERVLFYPGVHVQVVVPDVTTSDGERIECEIQLRTKAQDLWSVPSHQLVYKPLIAPSRETRRRILRLSVLVEIFDEEVASAMTELESMPGYEQALLLRAAEALYFTFVSEPGEPELSFEVLLALSSALPLTDDLPAFADSLARFVDRRRVKISNAYRDYGPYSDFASEWAYWLISQPESLIVWYLVETAPMALADAARGTELEGSISQLFAVWGSALPDPS